MEEDAHDRSASPQAIATVLDKALADAEHARQRLAFLASASETLASSLDYERTLAQVAHMAVPALADWCAVDLLQSDDSLRRVAAVHADADKAEIVRRLTDRFPSISSTTPHTAQRVLKSREPWFDPDVQEERFVAEARSDDHLAILRELGFAGEIVVPLTSRETVLGTLTLVIGPRRARYSQDDLDLANELARRCAVAIDNARLYAEAHEQAAVQVRLNAELRELVASEKAASHRASLLAQLSEALDAARLDLDAAVGALVRRTAEALERPCNVVLFDEDGQPALSRGHDVDASLSVELRAGDRILGTIRLGGRQATAAERELLAEIARRASPAIHNAQLHAAAEAAIAARDEFISVAAHDLRTPIASLRGYAQLALRQLASPGGPDAERVRTSVTAAVEQSERLTRMMERLLDVARLEGGKVRLERAEIDVATLVSDAVAALQAARSDRHIILSAAPVAALVDPVRLEQVITNLIDNAMKYSPLGEPVEVEVGPDPTDDTVLRVAVRDHGPGIPMERRARLFERYFQAQDDHAEHGVGLGLYITRHFVELHGGSISLEPAAGGGSEFTVRLPRFGESTAGPLNQYQSL